ncbi:hypothetical protein TRFO_24094 [Tritrichomonas foetus]|uniref:Rab-GAP TBC domain-containing protein n=1 Tax=Tritrichomonas foetus TaxID=1144522 RepID=A0A1J4K9P8_9EUKA|nr:hypothetical protein TRFO_24094 [Tritrichomonas foetus]|eukprot:OHT07674.1 hypothetical protein TRFO_24094 [Tritrichomonas foetus]
MNQFDHKVSAAPENIFPDIKVTKDSFTKITVRSSDFALQYLENSDISKPQYNRLVSWFVLFNLLSANSSEWPGKLNTLQQTYAEKSSNIDNDLEKLKGELPAIIPRDLGRSFSVFYQFYQDLHLTANYFDEEVLRIHRIFYFLTKECESFDYIQGLDRIVYLCVCVACSFCIQIGLNADYAESFGFYASKHFISEISIANQVLDPEQSSLIFMDVADFINTASAVTASAYKSQNLRADMYSMNFLLQLFAQQHEPVETLTLWDLIILHSKSSEKDKPFKIDEASKFRIIYSILMAHLMQVQIGVNTTETLQRILKTDDYNFTRLINDTNRFFLRKKISQVSNERSGGVPPGLVLIGVTAIALICGLLLYRFFQNN